jgi:hypothetical protein
LRPSGHDAEFEIGVYQYKEKRQPIIGRIEESGYLAVSGSFPFFHDFFNFIRGPEIDAMGQTDTISTGGQKSSIDPVMAQVAFRCHSLIAVEGNNMIGTCVNAEPASDAFLLIQDDDAVIPLRDRLLGAGFDAVRFDAVPAGIHLIDKIQCISHHPRTVFGDMDQFDPIR